jgi:hypothetical protein
MFPKTWLRSGVRARATALVPTRRAEAYALVERAISKYPPGFVEEHVERIYILSDLTFRGVRAGGSNSRRRIYVVIPPPGRGSGAYFERVFHSELSSVLLRRHRQLFDPNDWLRGTIPGFTYGASGAAAVRHGLADTHPTDWTLKQGFLYEYGMSSLENDWNSYAGYLLTHPERLTDFATRYPGVAHKQALTTRFYRALDPRFVF